MDEKKDAFTELVKRMREERDLQFRSHKRSNEIVFEFADRKEDDMKEVKSWQWCFTHGRYEPARWIN